MGDRIRHDASGVRTRSGTVVPRGGSRRFILRFPADVGLPVGTTVRVVLSDAEYWATPVEAFGSEERDIREVYPTREGAVSGDGAEGELQDWLQSEGLNAGRSVHLDVVSEEYRYGLRAPGETAQYPAGQPDTGLRDIARGLSDQGESDTNSSP